MKTVFMFSGQGAQYAGMGKDLYENYAVAKEVFDRADEVLGYSIKDICFSDEEKLGLTEFTQPAILTMSIAKSDIQEVSSCLSELIILRNLMKNMVLRQVMKYLIFLRMQSEDI